MAITAEPLDQFAVLSGDTSAIHMGERAAADAGFPGRGTYGMLLDAMISGMVGTELPGNDGLLQQAKFAFRAPCHPGDEIVIHLKVTDYFESVQALLMDVKVSKVGGLTLLTGQIQSGVRG